MTWPDDFINKIINGDCLEKLKELQNNSVDSVITDPPYGIGFMGKEWDTFKPSVIEKGVKISSRKRTEPIDGIKRDGSPAWEAARYNRTLAGNQEFQRWYTEVTKECLRVLKPGGHMLSCCGTRTQHRMASALEDAGFEIRDIVAWVYGSGFPKSLNIGKAVDKLEGNDREVWEGWGTALKPAMELWTLCRKPLAEKTVAENVLEWGTGGINIDGSRIKGEGWKRSENGTPDTMGKIYAGGKKRIAQESNQDGRWPANFTHDGSEEVVELFPNTKSGGGDRNSKGRTELFNGFGDTGVPRDFPSNQGSAARFFYIAKASKSERNQGLEEFETKTTDDGREKSIDNPFQRGETLRHNNHPTVKPVALMRYLCRLITPPGGIVLDPFMGSGSTGIAAKLEGFNFIGIEREEEYVRIAETRIKRWEANKQQKLLV